MNLRDLHHALYVLDAAAHKRFVRGVLDLPFELEREVLPEEMALTVLVDWLAHLGFLTDAQQFDVIRHFRCDLQGFARRIGPATLTGTNIEQFTLAGLLCRPGSQNTLPDGVHQLFNGVFLTHQHGVGDHSNLQHGIQNFAKLWH